MLRPICRPTVKPLLSCILRCHHTDTHIGRTHATKHTIPTKAHHSRFDDAVMKKVILRRSTGTSSPSETQGDSSEHPAAKAVHAKNATHASLPQQSNTSKDIRAAVAVSVGIVIVTFCIVGAGVWLFWIRRRDKRKQKEGIINGKQPSMLSDDESKPDKGGPRPPTMQSSNRNVESTLSPSSPARDYLSTSRSEEHTGPSLSPPVQSQRVRPFSPLRIVTRTPEQEEREWRQRDDDERSIQFNQVLIASPIVGKVLTESFDVKACDNRETFDWSRCAFEAREEEAMWLPPRPCSYLSSTRSLLHHHSRTCSDQSFSRYPSEAASQRGDGSRSCSQLFDSPSQSPQLPGIHTPQSADSETNLLRPPLTRSATGTDRSIAWPRAGESSAIYGDSVENLEEGGYLDALRHKDSAMSVCALYSAKMTFIDPFSESRATLVASTTQGTDTLRRAGAIALRSSPVFAGSPMEIARIKGDVRKRPSTTGTMHAAYPGYFTDARRQQRRQQQRRRKTTEMMGVFGNAEAACATAFDESHRYTRRDALVPSTHSMHYPSSTTASLDDWGV